MGVYGLLTLIVAAVGLLLWFLLAEGKLKAKLADAGRIAFAAGLLAFLFSASAQSCGGSLGASGAGSTNAAQRR